MRQAKVDRATRAATASRESVAASQVKRNRRHAARRVAVQALLKTEQKTDISWTQTTDEVQLRVPVHSGTGRKDIDFEVHPKRLRLTVKHKNLLEGSLADAGQINVDDCFWTLENEGDSKYVSITLGKHTMGHQSWDKLLASDVADTTVTDLVYLDIGAGVDDEPLGRIVVGLFGNVVPRTANNFRALCTGEQGAGPSGAPLHFRGCSFHRIIPGFMVQGGDFTAGDGTGGESIYGPTFEDENFKVQHDDAGYVAMANAGPNTNGSQFYILLEPQPHLNGKHVVFGRVVAGMDTVRKIEKFGQQNGQPTKDVKVVDCGTTTKEEMLKYQDQQELHRIISS